MSSARLVRWRSLKLKIAEATHAHALAQERQARRESDELLHQHQRICELGRTVENLDLGLMHWLAPIEQAMASAYESHLAETEERSDHRQLAAGQGAQARKRLELTSERARNLSLAHERTRELVELDTQGVRRGLGQEPGV